MRRLRHSVARGERGQALVEFAIASVVFLMTIFGTLQFALMVWHYNMISNLAQEGARWASVRGNSSTLPPATSGPSGTLQAFVQGRSPFPVSASLLTVSPVGPPGSIVSVQVQTTFAPLTGIVPMSTLTLSSTAQMIVAR